MGRRCAEMRMNTIKRRMRLNEKKEIIKLAPGVVVIATSSDVSGDKCQGCSICCYTDPVQFPEYRKPQFKTCVYQSAHGCTAYDQRPDGCRQYGCCWMRGEIPDSWRPTEIGAVFESSTLTGPYFKGALEIYVVAVADPEKFTVTAQQLWKQFPEAVVIISLEGQSPTYTGKGERIGWMLSAMMDKKVDKLPRGYCTIRMADQ
jgi:Fe-S-cluster containining protein